MSDDRQFERNARSWLELGPTDAPDRVIADALRTIESTPQERHLWMPWKDLRMSPSVRFATAAAIGVLVIGGGLLVFAIQPPQFGHASPVPSEAPSAAALSSANPNPASLTTDLQAKWVSVGNRVMPPSITGAPVTPTDIVIDATDLAIDGFKGWTHSSWSVIGSGSQIEVHLTQTAAYWNCQAGDLGSYAVALSTDRGTLSLTKVGDACATRAAILTGDWTRWPCPNPQSVCGPVLAPGQHTSVFRPNIDPNVQSVPGTYLGTYSYTVPAGWSDLGNALGRPNDPGSMAITLTLDVAPHSQAADCPDDVARGVGTSAADLAAWLHGLPGLVTTTPIPVTIGGYTGVMLDLSVAPTWTMRCQYSNELPQVFTFTDPADAVPVGDVFIRDYLERGSYARCLLLDIGPGHNLLIEVRAPDQASWNDLVPAAMPIINTFTFTRGTP